MAHTNITKYKASIGFCKCKQAIGPDTEFRTPNFPFTRESVHRCDVFPYKLQHKHKDKKYIAYEINQKPIYITHIQKLER